MGEKVSSKEVSNSNQSKELNDYECLLFRLEEIKERITALEETLS